MFNSKKTAWDVLCEQDGETVVRLLTRYHGMRLFDEGFLEHLKEEGYIKDDDEPEDDEPEDDDYIPEDDDEPEDDDYIISDASPLSSMTVVTVMNGQWADGIRVRSFDSEEAAVKAIKEDMAAQKYRPNVWRADDHGGMSLFDMAY